MIKKIVTTKKHDTSPFKSGLECQVVRMGEFKETHIAPNGIETVLEYDMEVIMPSGYKTFVRRSWFL